MTTTTRTPPDHLAGLDRLAHVSLDEVLALAPLQSRRDRKYVLQRTEFPAFLADLPPTTRVLAIERRTLMGYQSVYFDTDSLHCFRSTARKRPQRAKVRTRTYLDTGRTWLEVKQRDRCGMTHKLRQPHARQDAYDLADGAAFVDAVQDRVSAASLSPVLRTTYKRVTLLLDDAVRATIDVGLQCVDLRDGSTVSPDGLVLIETKSPAGPSACDRLLWRHGHRPTKVSKYATGLCALHPELPSNRWHRVLHRNFPTT